MSWTDERVTMLGELWAMGLSLSQIAERINAAWPNLKPITRNAVIGKRVRIKLPNRAGYGSRVRGCEAIKRIKRRKADVAKARTKIAFGNPAVRALFKADGYVPPQEEIVVPEKERRGIADLKDDQCRWPVGDPQEPRFHFCNRTKMIGLSYCEAHARRAFETPQMRRAAAAENLVPVNAKEAVDA